MMPGATITSAMARLLCQGHRRDKKGKSCVLTALELLCQNYHRLETTMNSICSYLHLPNGAALNPRVGCFVHSYYPGKH